MEKRYRIMSDYDGHNYLIEEFESEEFQKLLDTDDDFKSFSERFHSRMCSMSSNFLTFTDPKWDN